MPALEQGHLNLNYPAQDKKLQANPAHNLCLSFVSYGHTRDGDLLLKLQTGEYYVVLTHEDGSSYFLEAVNVLPELLKLSGEHESVYIYEYFYVPCSTSTLDCLAEM